MLNSGLRGSAKTFLSPCLQITGGRLTPSSKVLVIDLSIELQMIQLDVEDRDVSANF